MFFGIAFLWDFFGDFPGGSDGKESACSAGDQGLIPGLGRSPGEEMAIHSPLLPGKSHEQWILIGYSS